jgi:spore cortex formation protein SpoVR/YcgB (stage V sporulation)
MPDHPRYRGTKGRIRVKCRVDAAGNIENRDDQRQNTDRDAESAVIDEEKNNEANAKEEESDMDEDGKTLDDELEMPSPEAAEPATV